MTAPRRTGARRAAPGRSAGTARWPWIALIVLGVGLAAAPAVFGMFQRAPGGGRMLADFRPFMTEQRLGGFADHLDTIDAATAGATGPLATAVAETSGPELPATEQMAAAWPALEERMRGMLADMRDNLEAFAAVDALPPFALFPWFFVAPGVLVAAAAGWGLRRALAGGPTRGPRIALAVLGVGLVAAPVAFRMFSRAPAGAAMIDDLRPLMSREQVTAMQEGFLTIGAMEAELRTTALPAVTDGRAAETFPAVTDLVDAWPRMSADMAPMIGAMADHLDDFAGIDALPPFWLFPWFFVAPGLLTAGLAAVAGRSGDDEPTLATT